MEAAAFIIACATFGVFLGRSWDAAAIALGLTLLIAVSHITAVP